jgi:hypothetical protein
MTKAKKQTEQAAQPMVVSFKGFDKDLKCRDFQFAVGQSYTHEGSVRACQGGFHACENPLDVFQYYEPGVSRFAQVEQSGELSRHDEDSKIASQHIAIKAELSIAGFVSAAFEYVKSKCEPAKAEHATGDSSASSATGDSSASSATGDRSASSATGDRSASSATGDSSASSATGDSSASSATGDRSASSATGDRSASSATGYSSASSATGDRSASSATGDRSASLATGWYSSSEIKPDADNRALQGVAIATGYSGKARAPLGSAIVLVERDSQGVILALFASKVGENGIKANTFYSLSNGAPLERA